MLPRSDLHNTDHTTRHTLPQLGNLFFIERVSSMSVLRVGAHHDPRPTVPSLGFGRGKVNGGSATVLLSARFAGELQHFHHKKVHGIAVLLLRIRDFVSAVRARGCAEAVWAPYIVSLARVLNRKNCVYCIGYRSRTFRRSYNNVGQVCMHDSTHRLPRQTQRGHHAHEVLG